MDNVAAMVAAPVRLPRCRLVIQAWVRPDGVRVVSSEHWPKLRRPRRMPAHPLIRWLARWLPIEPFVTVTRIEYADPILHRASNTLYCHNEQREAMIEAGTLSYRAWWY
jgi:hypothetical protein